MFETNQERAIKYTTYEGIAASVVSSLTSSFLAVFASSLGADAVFIGLLASLPTLAWTLMQLPSAFFVQLTGKRKAISILSSFFGRFVWIFVGLTPLMFNNSLDMILLFAIIANAGSALIGPAWASWIGSIIPRGERGKYFGRRNALAVGFSVVIVLMCGLFLESVGAPGFVVIFLIASAAGVMTTIFFARTPHKPYPRRNVNPLSEVRQAMQNKNFKFFILVFMVWQFGVMIWSPFSDVYLVKSIGGSYFWVSMHFVSSAIATVAFQKIWGRLSDKYSHRSVMIVGSAGAAVVPFMWVLMSGPWMVIPIEIFSGMMWAGFNMASFNYILEISPDDKRPFYSAIFWTIMGTSGFAAPMIGGWLSSSGFALLSVSGFGVLALLSGIIRFGGFVMFSKLVQDLPEKKSSVKYVAGEFARTTATFMLSPLLPVKKNPKQAVTKQASAAKPVQRRKYKFRRR